MKHCWTIRKTNSRRRGVQTLELILALPILVLLLFGCMQLSTMLTVKNSICAAAMEAGRCAGSGAELSEIEGVVDDILGVHNMVLGPGVRLVLQDADGQVVSAGDENLSTDATAEPPPAGMIRSIVLVSADSAPVPNMLAQYCIDMTNRRFECCTLTSSHHAGFIR